MYQIIATQTRPVSNPNHCSYAVTAKIARFPIFKRRNPPKHNQSVTESARLYQLNDAQGTFPGRHSENQYRQGFARFPIFRSLASILKMRIACAGVSDPVSISTLHISRQQRPCAQAIADFIRSNNPDACRPGSIDRTKKPGHAGFLFSVSISCDQW